MDSETNLFKVKLAQEAERYDEMAQYITEIIEKTPRPTFNEIELLSIAYKNSVTSRRQAWKILKSLETESTQYQTDIKAELKSICDRILTLINKQLIPNATEIKSRIAFLKLIGDFNRYLAETSENDEKQNFAENAAVAYKEASELALSELPATDSLRLGTALNFSVFFYDILNKSDKAQAIAKAAYNEAVNQLDTLTDETYKDTITALQLLKDNLSVWEME